MTPPGMVVVYALVAYVDAVCVLLLVLWAVDRYRDRNIIVDRTRHRRRNRW